MDKVTEFIFYIESNNQYSFNLLGFNSPQLCCEEFHLKITDRIWGLNEK